MQQYFVKEIINNFAVLDEEAKHHLKNVMRTKPGKICRVVDQNNQAYFAKCKYIEQDVQLEIISVDDKSNEMNCSITLCIGLIKKDKWDFVLQKATELGVSKIVPFNSSRTIVKVDSNKLANKQKRWKKIILEASEQCKRTNVPEIIAPVSINDLKEYQSSINLLAYEDVKYSGQKIRDIVKKQQDITLVIGPEGGFSEKEVELLTQSNFTCVTLGKRILRAETAVCYALSAIDALVE